MSETVMGERLSTHKVTKVEIIPYGREKYGVRFEFDDGTADYAFSDTKEEAEWDARDRIGEEMPIDMNPKLRSAERLQKLKDASTGQNGYPDANDGKPWSEADIEDLKTAIAGGSSLKATAEFLCRSGTLPEVAAKATELGLTWQQGGVKRNPDK